MHYFPCFLERTILGNGTVGEEYAVEGGPWRQVGKEKIKEVKVTLWEEMKRDL